MTYLMIVTRLKLKYVLNIFDQGIRLWLDTKNAKFLETKWKTIYNRLFSFCGFHKNRLFYLFNNPTVSLQQTCIYLVILFNVNHDLKALKFLNFQSSDSILHEFG